MKTKRNGDRMKSKLPSIDGIIVHCSHDRIVPLAELKLNQRNYNKHPAQQIDLLAKNIKAVGWRHPITVSKLSGLIVAGHARVRGPGLEGFQLHRAAWIICAHKGRKWSMK
jgi:hypothetical protein